MKTRLDVLLNRRNELQDELDYHLEIMYTKYSSVSIAQAEESVNLLRDEIKAVDNLLLKEVSK